MVVWKKKKRKKNVKRIFTCSGTFLFGWKWRFGSNRWINIKKEIILLSTYWLEFEINYIFYYYLSFVVYKGNSLKEYFTFFFNEMSMNNILFLILKFCNWKFFKLNFVKHYVWDNFFFFTEIIYYFQKVFLKFHFVKFWIIQFNSNWCGVLSSRFSQLSKCSVIYLLKLFNLWGIGSCLSFQSTLSPITCKIRLRYKFYLSVLLIFVICDFTNLHILPKNLKLTNDWK